MPSRSPSVTPKLMTFGITIAGLLPMIWSTKAGAEVMKPLAIPVLGGTVSARKPGGVLLWLAASRFGWGGLPCPGGQYGLEFPPAGRGT